MAVTDMMMPPLRGGFASVTPQAGRLRWQAWVFLLAVVIPMGIQVGPLALTALRLFLMVMIIPLMVRLFLGHFGKIFATDVLFVLHIIWATVALAINNPNMVIEQTGSVGMEFLGGYVMGRAYIRTRADFAALARALIIIVLAMVPIALVETTTGRPLLLEALRMIPGVKTVALNYQDPRFGLERVQMGFAHPIHFGLFCSVTFSLCFVAMEGTFSAARRWITASIIAGMAFLALSSGALLAIVLQFGLIAWAMMFKFEKRWWLLVGLAVLAYIAIDLLSNRKPIQVFMSYATFSAHTAYWRALIFEWGMINVWKHPIFGLGLNDWERPFYMYSGSMDNFWLVMAVRYGIPGFLTVTAGYVLVVARVMRRDFSADPVLTQFRRAWVFTFLGLSFTLCTVHVWTNIYAFTFFMLGAGTWLILADTVEDAKLPDTTPDTQSPFSRSPRGLVAPQVRDMKAPPRKDATKPKRAPARYSRFTGDDGP